MALQECTYFDAGCLSEAQFIYPVMPSAKTTVLFDVRTPYSRSTKTKCLKLFLLYAHLSALKVFVLNF